MADAQQNDENRLVDVEEIPGIWDEVEEEGEDLSEQLKQVCASLGDDEESAKIRVSRKGDGRKSGEWLFEENVGDVTIDEIFATLRDEYGGGEFKIEVRVKGQIKTRKIASIGKPRSGIFNKNKAEENLESKKLMEAIEKISQPNSGMDMNSMLTFMLKQQQDQMRLILDAVKSAQPAQQQQGTGLKDIMEMVVMLQGLNGGDKKGDELGSFLKGLNLGKELGEGENQSGLATIFSKLAEPAAEIIKAQAVADHQSVKREDEHAQQQPQKRIEHKREEVKPLTEESADMLDMLDIYPYRGFLPIIFTAAELDQDQETYANLMLDQIPEDIVKKYVSNEAGFNRLINLMPPEAEQFLPWFVELRKTVITFLQEEEGADGESENVPEGEESKTGGEVPSSTGSDT